LSPVVAVWRAKLLGGWGCVWGLWLLLGWCWVAYGLLGGWLACWLVGLQKDLHLFFVLVSGGLGCV